MSLFFGIFLQKEIMETDYYYSSPETQKYHLFLQELNTIKSDAKKNEIIDIAKRCFELSFFSDLDLHKEISQSVKVLMDEMPRMNSSSQPLKEVAGAINGLTFLLVDENLEKQKVILEEIKKLGLYIKTVEDYFCIKNAINTSSLKLNFLLNDSQFFDTFGDITALCRGKMDNMSLLSLLKGCEDIKIRFMLYPFIKRAIKKTELDQSYDDLLVVAKKLLTEEIYLNFKSVIDDLYKRAKEQ